MGIIAQFVQLAEAGLSSVSVHRQFLVDCPLHVLVDASERGSSVEPFDGPTQHGHSVQVPRHIVLTPC